MDEEGFLVEFLAKESEKIDEESWERGRRNRASLPGYELSAWNEETRDHGARFIRQQHRTQNQSTELLIRKYSEHQMWIRKYSQAGKKSVIPVMYNIPKMCVQDTKPSFFCKFSKPRSTFFLNKHKHKATSERIDEQHPKTIKALLRDQSKNPLTSAVIPRMKSRSELYRFSTKKTPKLTPSPSEHLSLEPKHDLAKPYNLINY